MNLAADLSGFVCKVVHNTLKTDIHNCQSVSYHVETSPYISEMPRTYIGLLLQSVGGAYDIPLAISPPAAIPLNVN